MIKFNLDWLLKSSCKSSNENILSSDLITERLILKSPCLEDYLNWRDVRQHNQKFLTPYEPTWPKDCLSIGYFKRRLERQRQERRAGRGAFFFLHHNHKIIGGLNLNNIQMGAARHATLGYWIDEALQGQGLMREAIGRVVEFGFDDLKLRHFNAACLPNNNRSIQLLLRLGFEKEGYAKKYLQINGQWRDHQLFGLCRPEGED